ncbi:MAG: hypothetical protein LBH43_07770 [Treponema sp.]|jgi:hypothetical protein|nr:hypothetical protein [Treponema sp.]
MLWTIKELLERKQKKNDDTEKSIYYKWVFCIKYLYQNSTGKFLTEALVMKQKLNFVWLVVMTMLITGAFIGCQSVPLPDPEYPEGIPGIVLAGLQAVWNEYVPPVKEPISGKEYTYVFEGDRWIQKIDDKQVGAGRFDVEKNASNPDEYDIAMVQDHAYSDKKVKQFLFFGEEREIGWQKTPDKTIMTLKYSPGPPASVKDVKLSL